MPQRNRPPETLRPRQPDYYYFVIIEMGMLLIGNNNRNRFFNLEIVEEGGVIFSDEEGGVEIMRPGRPNCYYFEIMEMGIVLFGNNRRGGLYILAQRSRQPYSLFKNNRNGFCIIFCGNDEATAAELLFFPQIISQPHFVK